MMIDPSTAISRFNLSHLSKYFWPSTDYEGKDAEFKLLAKLPFLPLAAHPNAHARIGPVHLDEGRYINTLWMETDPSPSYNEADAHIPSVPQNDTKTTVVLAHGYGAGLGFFYRNYPAMVNLPNTRIYSIDWLGMGRSARVPFPKINNLKNVEERVRTAEEFFVESLEAWRAKLNIDKMVLAGHSLGGYLSVAYYERYPQHVEKLILLSPVGLPENPNKDGEKEIIPQGDPAFTRGNADYDGLEEPTTEFRPAGAPRRKMPGWIGHVWDWNLTPQWLVRASGPLGSRLVGGYVQRRMNHLPEEERATFHKYMYHITTLSGSGEYSLAHLLAPGAFARKPLMTRLANVRVPVTFIYGELDWMDYRHAAVASKRMDVPTKIERIPAGGHHMYLENAAEFDRAFGEAVLLS